MTHTGDVPAEGDKIPVPDDLGGRATTPPVPAPAPTPPPGSGGRLSPHAPPWMHEAQRKQQASAAGPVTPPGTPMQPGFVPPTGAGPMLPPGQVPPPNFGGPPGFAGMPPGGLHRGGPHPAGPYPGGPYPGGAYPGGVPCGGRPMPPGMVPYPGPGMRPGPGPGWSPYPMYPTVKGPPSVHALSILLGVFVGFVVPPLLAGLVALITAPPYENPFSSIGAYIGMAFVPAMVIIHLMLVLGIVLAVLKRPKLRGWGFGLLIAYPLVLMVGPVLGLIACFGGAA